VAVSGDGARDGDVVRAAGGVVWQEGPDGVEVVLVHRSQYDDWGFPKGKNDPGETDEDCAVREIGEETALSCVIESELGTSRYRDGGGRPKVVRWFVMRPVDGTLAPQEEIDQAGWFSAAKAREQLTYERDRELLDEFLEHHARAREPGA
jgi:8-oxo-dGTP diphosphatase